MSYSQSATTVQLHDGSATADEALAFPLSRLAYDGRKASQCNGLFILKTAEFRHGGNELIGGQRSHSRDAGQDLVPAGECGVGSDKGGDLGIERLDMSVDLFRPLPTLALEQGDGEVFLAVLERSAIPHQPVASIDELCHLSLLHAACGPDRRLQGGGHARQQHGINAIRVGKGAGGLRKAPGPFRVEFDTGPVGQCDLQRTVVGRRRLIGHAFEPPQIPKRTYDLTQHLLVPPLNQSSTHHKCNLTGPGPSLLAR